MTTSAITKKHFMSSLGVIDGSPIKWQTGNKDILSIVFRYLSFQDQIKVSRVCRAWYVTVRDPKLSYGHMFAVMRMLVSQPKVTCFDTFLKATRREFDYRLICSNSHFFVLNKCYYFCWIIDRLQEKKILELDLRKALTEDQLKHRVFKFQEILNSFFVSKNRFVTISIFGTFAVWEIFETEVKLIDRLDFFNAEEQQCAIENGNNAAHLKIRGMALHGTTLYVNKSGFFKDGFYNFIHRLNLSNLSCLTPETLPFEPFKFRITFNINCDFIFGIDTDLKLIAYKIEKMEKMEMGWVTQLSGKNPDILRVNDQYLVVVSNDGFIQVFNSRTGSEVFKIQENSHSLGYWLCGELLMICKDYQLDVWHIEGKSHLACFNIAGFYSRDEFPPPQGWPIINIFMNDFKELEIIAESRSGPPIRILKFALQDDLDEHSLEASQENPPYSLKKAGSKSGFLENFKSLFF